MNKIYKYFMDCQTPSKWEWCENGETKPSEYRKCTRFYLWWEVTGEEVWFWLRDFYLGKIRYNFKRIQFAYQRARYGIDDTMTYDLYNYIVLHLIDLFNQYEKQSVGSIVIDKDFQDYIDRSKKALMNFISLDEMDVDNIEKIREAILNLKQIFDPDYFPKLWN